MRKSIERKYERPGCLPERWLLTYHLRNGDNDPCKLYRACDFQAADAEDALVWSLARVQRTVRNLRHHSLSSVILAPYKDPFIVFGEELFWFSPRLLKSGSGSKVLKVQDPHECFISGKDCRKS